MELVPFQTMALLLLIALCVSGVNCICNWERGRATCSLDRGVLPTFDLSTEVMSFNCTGVDLDLRALERYMRVSELVTSSCRVQNILAICRLENLRTLSLYKGGIQELPLFPEDCLRHVTSISFRQNRIRSLQPGVFVAQEHLSDLDLSSNEISSLRDASFAGLVELQMLDLSNNGLQFLSRDPFRGLLRLVLLKLNGNKLSAVESGLLRDLSSLQELDLSNNNIDRVDFGAFDNLQNLHTLKLGHNQLAVLDGYTFRGLNGLASLEIDFNNLTRIANGSFRPCLGLSELSVRGNRLTHLPRAVSDLTMLKKLDVSDNAIMSIDDDLFVNTSQLVSLLLNNNQLQSIMARGLYGLSKLEVLEVASNRLELIEAGSLDGSENLQEIRFDSNFLEDVNGLFRNLMKLRSVNLSSNGVQLFDYSFLPLSVESLDLHSNEISEMSNYYELETRMNIKFIDLSFNRIAVINEKDVPNSAEIVLLNNNAISKVASNAFSAKTNLTSIDLRNNHLKHLEPTAVWLRDEQQRVEVRLGHNPFVCDCGLEWLARLTNQTRHQPAVADVEDVTCHPVSAPEVLKKVVDVRTDEFLCQYDTHCFALCHCCDFDACDCEMACPVGCRCYHDAAWGTNLVDCSSSDLSDIPSRVPMDVTHLRLDGNPLAGLGSHSFIGRKNLRILHINNSQISQLQNRTFYGIPNVAVLHLEDNLLVELSGGEFEPLETLMELYLQNNLLDFLPSNVFSTLTVLKVLNLSGNRLRSVSFSMLPPSMQMIQIQNNPLKCDGCLTRAVASLPPQLIVDSNMTDLFCTEVTFMGTKNHRKLLELDLPCANESSSIAPVHAVDPVAVIAASVAVVIVLLGCFVAIVLLKRDHLSLWLQAKNELPYGNNGYVPSDKTATLRPDFYMVSRQNRYELEPVQTDSEHEYMTIGPKHSELRTQEWEVRYPVRTLDSVNEGSCKALYV